MEERTRQSTADAENTADIVADSPDAIAPEDETHRLSRHEVEQLMEMRKSIYRLFSSLYFKELTRDQIDYLHGEAFEGMGDLEPNISEGVHNIKRALRRVNSGTCEDLAVDYAHTFLAAGSSKSETRACPYESVFTSHEGLIMQKARDDVYRYMLNEHLEPDQSLHIPDDHIAFVFEFMANLCARYNESSRKGDLAEALRLCSLQREFFDKHIGNWIDKFCDAIEACCRTSFYRGVAQMTRGFANVESAILPVMEYEIALHQTRQPKSKVRKKQENKAASATHEKASVQMKEA